LRWWFGRDRRRDRFRGIATGIDVGRPSSAALPPAPSSAAGSTQAPAPVASNPPGDIPDNAAFVACRNTAGRYGFTFPEEWARSERGTAVKFTDRLNGIAAVSGGGGRLERKRPFTLLRLTGTPMYSLARVVLLE
jgi:hypothetical protein